MENTLLNILDPFLWNKLDKNMTKTSSLSRFKLPIRCKDFTELINHATIAPRALSVPLKVCPCS